jgi:hypothetical protein
MTTTKKLTRKKSINPNNYVNTNTGELLASEYAGLSSVTITDADLEIVSSKEYVVLDSVALNYIAHYFNTVDLGKIIKMSNMVQTNFNILSDRKHEPHSERTLMVELETSVNKFRDFLKRLYDKGIIAYLLLKKDGIERKHIILNPNIARKRKSYHKDCLKLFQDFNLKDLSKKTYKKSTETSES